MKEEVNEMQILLQKAIYIPSEANLKYLMQAILDQSQADTSRLAPEEFKDAKFGSHNPAARVSNIDIGIRDSSQIEGFDNIQI